MYAILISAALAIYSIILVDFSVLYQEIAINNDLLTSTQALYTAEGAIENTLGLIGDNDLTLSNIVFYDESNKTGDLGRRDYLSYNEGSDAFYIQRKLSLDSPDLNAIEGSHKYNRATYSEAYLSDGQTLDQKAYYGLEARKAKGFVIREVESGSDFNEIKFEFNEGGETSELLFEIFVIPKEGENINFKSFKELENNPTNNQIKRISINTLDSSSYGLAFGTGGVPLSVDVHGIGGAYKKELIVSNFMPLQNNYILYFQTLDNKPVHYKLAAYRDNKPVVLPNMMQTIDVIGATASGLYSRVKYQRQSEEGIAPGLNFVHFTQESLIK